MSRGARIAIAVAAVAVGIGTSAVLHGDAPVATADEVLALVIGWSFVASGLVAWARRPGNRTGPLLVVVGFLWLIGRLDFADDPTAQTIGAWVRPLHVAVFVHLLLAFPSGRLETRGARLLAAAAYANVAIVDNAPEVIGDERAAELLFDISQTVTALIFAAVIVVLVERWRRASVASRRVFAPLLWPGSLALATLVLFAANGVLDQPLGEGPGWVFRAVYAAFPLLFLVGLLRTRLARTSVAELVLELNGARPPGALRDALARALGDPSVSLAYWLPDEHRYVDLEGRPVALPRGGEGRAATLVERDGRRVAAIVHDEALSDEAELLRSVSAAAALALENERLQAELRARLEELRASRVRIVEAADAERRRIERNLHDGTQQRLTSVTLALGLAESKLRTDPEAALATLRQARKGLGAALAELRELSQGIHPSVLAERGLGPALEDLAFAAPLPVRVQADLNGRLPEEVEAGAYFVVAEALANVAKHAGASSAVVTVGVRDGRLELSVRDDGRGGAEIGAGTGLRGLADRVQALRGTFAVSSTPGKGTEVKAAIPCA